MLKLNPNCIGLKGSPIIVKKIEFMPKVERKREVCSEKDPVKAAEWLVRKLMDEGLLEL